MVWWQGSLIDPLQNLLVHYSCEDCSFVPSPDKLVVVRNAKPTVLHAVILPQVATRAVLTIMLSQRKPKNHSQVRNSNTINVVTTSPVLLWHLPASGVDRLSRSC